jgi:hypothetical protein
VIEALDAAMTYQKKPRLDTGAKEVFRGETTEVKREVTPSPSRA